MKKTIMITIIITLFILLIFAGCYDIKKVDDDEEEQDPNEAKIMTIAELIDDIALPLEDDKIILDFKHLEDGDKITIKDKIDEIYLHKLDDLNYTEIVFKYKSLNFSYYFENDLTDLFSEEETVAITYHIQHLEGVRYEGDEAIDYSIECPLEGFDEELFLEEILILMPENCIEKIVTI